jgi:hypothetical protein
MQALFLIFFFIFSSQTLPLHTVAGFTHRQKQYQRQHLCIIFLLEPQLEPP